MLRLRSIGKTYDTGGFSQVALNDVSLSFRDSEFVAILGPSGSGKTTLLNIIGGLDHATSGDLLIDGISTKNYSSKDWDTFRNNRVGFIFQSYNLIPHQTVLANVELALTLSGVGRDERRRRALEALEEVGLAEHARKRPNQLSGGQMQRVAIARALVNDPEIVLADEPTGALDSKTSVAIMDLLRDIAKDRLVVMVTHNPELAEEYATRIVSLADGSIVSDSRPYDPEAEGAEERVREIRPARMGFLTALSLSFNNLMTKKGRTIMTAFAGSIGIIGIAAILALANGVNAYIQHVEEDTLSSYPIQITSSSFDMTSMMGISMDLDPEAEPEGDDELKEVGVIDRMFSSFGNNDLASLKSYLDENAAEVSEYARTVEYTYDVTPQVYNADTSEGVDKINPDETFSALGIGMGQSQFMASFVSTDIFDELPSDMDIVKEQYDLVRGTWPEKPTDLLMVLGRDGTVSDFELYVLGIRDGDQLDAMVRQLANEETVEVVEDDATYTYDDLMNVKMKLVCAADYYSYDSEHEVWVDKTDDEAYMENLIAEGEDLQVVGVIEPTEEATSAFLTAGVYYTPELVEHLIDEAAETQVVKDQLNDPKVDVFNGKTFAEEQEGEDESGFDSNSLFSIDEDAMRDAFKFDEAALQIDESALDLGGVDLSGLDMSGLGGPGAAEVPDMSFTLEDLGIDPSQLVQPMPPELVETMTQSLAGAYAAYLQAWGAGGHEPGPDGTIEQPLSFDEWLETPDAQAIVGGFIDRYTTSVTTAVMQQITAAMGTYMNEVMTVYANQVQQQVEAQMALLTDAISEQIEEQMAQMMQAVSTQLAQNLQNAISIDADAFAGAFKMNVDEDTLSELILAMLSSDQASYEGNLAQLGYADLAEPSQIEIYPKDFEAKQSIIDILDTYNRTMADRGEDEKTISYTDIVGTLMTSVTTIIDMISTMLIAFVSISLVVSSIMIGIITYISVLERTKEIGILRAMGASRGDVSAIFDAETVIEGLAAGILGVGVTLFASIFVNIIVLDTFDVPNIMQLSPVAAIVLVLISVGLSFIAGLIPASSAAHKDPVEALRTE